MMSDDSETTFREQVEEIKEQRSEDRASDEQNSFSEKESAQDDADQSFRERVEEIRNERKEGREGRSGEVENFQEEISQQGQWGIVVGTFLVGGILGAVSNAEPVMGFFVGGLFFGGVAWAFATESGENFRKEFKENMEEAQQQQQQTSSNSKPKVVCSNCGWKNPKANNYCHDCGEQLKS
jgi:hypothetical protein